MSKNLLCHEFAISQSIHSRCSMALSSRCGVDGLGKPVYSPRHFRRWHIQGNFLSDLGNAVQLTRNHDAFLTD